MKLAAGTKINAPVDAVWAEVAEEQFWAELLTALGLELKRVEGSAPGMSEGASWEAQSKHKLMSGKVGLAVEKVERPHRIVLKTVATGIDGTVRVIVKEVESGTSRLRVVTELSSRGAMGKMTMSALKLASGRIEKRYHAAVLNAARKVTRALG
ncbi:SRPBCC family protein [Tropicimonas isoalkanivorans]|uniref:Polyketide cyclase / dehydrase and lipid transport n=1 Tax=Tropicimonas isoalkanivorans TaxID=441112 RepID=A0A1I1QS24_9RHOB|nr:SRPBCC family protein [Tropicimonas isoalkanivorans]SFD24924.1 hypothetical protein SAMN04488094_12319 [Tropicimonas isoalkanivorans]